MTDRTRDNRRFSFLTGRSRMWLDDVIGEFVEDDAEAWAEDEFWPEDELNEADHDGAKWYGHDGEHDGWSVIRRRSSEHRYAG